jgi:hypothetical protein
MFGVSKTRRDREFGSPFLQPGVNCEPDSIEPALRKDITGFAHPWVAELSEAAADSGLALNVPG